MKIPATRENSENISNSIKSACKNIIDDADYIASDIDYVTEILITISLEPQSIATYEVKKTKIVRQKEGNDE